MLISLLDPGLTPLSKAAYCRLLLHLYVDAEPLHDRSDSLDREWDDIGDSALARKAVADIARLMVLPDGSDGLKPILDWIDDFLKGPHVLSLEAETQHHQHLHQAGKKKRAKVSKAMLETDLQQVHAEQARNQLAWRVLQLVHGLFQFGFYHDAQRRESLARNVLRVLLNSRTSDGEVLALSHAHETVMNAKSCACEILVKYLQAERNGLFSALLGNFHQQYTVLAATRVQHHSAHLKSCNEEALASIPSLAQNE